MGDTILVNQMVSSSEKEIVTWLSNGLTAKDISKLRKRSVRTIEGALDKIRAEYGCRNAAHLVGLFFRNKLIK